MPWGGVHAACLVALVQVLAACGDGAADDADGVPAAGTGGAPVEYSDP